MKKRKIWGFWHYHTPAEVAAWQGTDTSQAADEWRGEDVQHLATTASYLADNNAAAIFIRERSKLLNQPLL